MIFLFTINKSRRAGEMTTRLDNDADALMRRLMEYTARKKRVERLAQLALGIEVDEAEISYCREQLTFLLQKEEDTKLRSTDILRAEVGVGDANQADFLGDHYAWDVVGRMGIEGEPPDVELESLTRSSNAFAPKQLEVAATPDENRLEEYVEQHEDGDLLTPAEDFLMLNFTGIELEGSEESPAPELVAPESLEEEAPLIAEVSTSQLIIDAMENDMNELTNLMARLEEK